MRHGISGRKFNRHCRHRNALLVNLAVSLIEHEQISTTLAKAKDLRPYVERMVTRARDKSLHSRRVLLSQLRNNENAVNKLIGELAPRYQSRAGDNAPRAFIEFVDRNPAAKGAGVVRVEAEAA
jgi:large subunit ribosomal protein L17